MADIASATDQLRDRCHIPKLRHAEQCSQPAETYSSDTSPPEGQLVRLAPIVPIIRRPSAFAKDVMFLCYYDEKDHSPITNDGEKSGQRELERQRREATNNC